MESSIKNITDQAGVAVGSFYTYFSNKEEVLSQIYEGVSNRSLTIAAKATSCEKDDAVKKFVQALAAAVNVCLENEAQAKLFFLRAMAVNETFEQKRWEILSRVNDFFRQLLVHLKEEHGIHCTDQETTAVILSESIFGVITYRLAVSSSKGVEEMLFTLCTYHLNALGMQYTEDEVRQSIKEGLRK